MGRFVGHSPHVFANVEVESVVPVVFHAHNFAEEHGPEIFNVERIDQIALALLELHGGNQGAGTVQFFLEHERQRDEVILKERFLKIHLKQHAVIAMSVAWHREVVKDLHIFNG